MASIKMSAREKVILILFVSLFGFLLSRLSGETSFVNLLYSLLTGALLFGASGVFGYVSMFFFTPDIAKKIHDKCDDELFYVFAFFGSSVFLIARLVA